MIHNPSSIGRRLAAMLYESLVVFAILLVGFMFPQIVLSGFGINLSGKAMWLHLFLVLMGYFTWFWLNGGQTLPMKTWKLRLVDHSGYPPRPLQAILRYLAAWPSIALLGIGIFWALFDRDGQFLHDRIAGTRIVTEPASAPLNPPNQNPGSQQE
jgi:uncharacterized RDD family membrane protein YckC